MKRMEGKCLTKVEVRGITARRWQEVREQADICCLSGEGESVVEN